MIPLQHRFPTWRSFRLLIGLLHAEGTLDAAGRVRWQCIDGWTCREERNS